MYVLISIIHTFLNCCGNFKNKDKVRNNIALLQTGLRLNVKPTIKYFEKLPIPRFW